MKFDKESKSEKNSRAGCGRNGGGGEGADGWSITINS